MKVRGLSIIGDHVADWYFVFIGRSERMYFMAVNRAHIEKSVRHSHNDEQDLKTHNHTYDHNTHTPQHTHTHTHTHHNTKAVLNRLSRAIGHMEAVKRMVEDGKDCSEVLIQLSAVIAALNNTGKVILTDHISHCIVDAVETGDKEAIEKLNAAISRFIK